MTRSMFTFQMTVAGMLVLLSVATPVPADLTNGNFQAGTSGWNWSDDTASLYESDEGQRWARLVEPPGHTGTVYASIQQQDISMPQGAAALSFDFSMTTFQDAETDYFQVELNNVGNFNELFTIASTDSGTLDLAGEYPSPRAGWYRVNRDVSDLASGNWTLIFRLEGNEDGWATMVDIDNVELSAVPVPGAVVLGSMGLALAGWLCRRRTC